MLRGFSNTIFAAPWSTTPEPNSFTSPVSSIKDIEAIASSVSQVIVIELDPIVILLP